MGLQPGDQIVLVNPSEVVQCMKQVPAGRLVTIGEICKHLAQKYRVKGCCSLTVGSIFIMIAAHAAEQAEAEDQDWQIPYWRTLKADGYLHPKFPGGVESHKRLLEQEGFRVVRVGQGGRVVDYPRDLFQEW